MGIQTIERNLRKASVDTHTNTGTGAGSGTDTPSRAQQKMDDNLEALADTRSAFDNAIAILNDLLNFDKLESGTFQIEPTEVQAQTYLGMCLKQQLSLMQSRDMTATLNFDVDEGCGGHTEDGLQFIDSCDVLYVDTHKVASIPSPTHFSSPLTPLSSLISLASHNPPLSCHSYSAPLTSLSHPIFPPQFTSQRNAPTPLSPHIPTPPSLPLSPIHPLSLPRPSQLDQVFRNLCSNALKFTPAGKTVTVRVRKESISMGLTRRKPAGGGGSGSFRSTGSMMGGLASVLHLSSKSGSGSGKSAARGTSVDAGTGARARVSSRIGSSRVRNIQVAGTGDEADAADLEAGRGGGGLSRGQSYVFSNLARSEVKKDGGRVAVGMLVVQVIDEGVGIAKEDQAKLFKEIVQFNPGALQAGGGSGLGMMISKGITDMHGGTLSVWSAGEGHGTTFTLRLPLYSSASADDRRTKRIAQRTVRQPTLQPSRSVSDNLLLAELRVVDVSSSTRALVHKDAPVKASLIAAQSDSLPSLVPSAAPLLASSGAPSGVSFSSSLDVAMDMPASVPWAVKPSAPAVSPELFSRSGEVRGSGIVAGIGGGSVTGSGSGSGSGSAWNEDRRRRATVEHPGFDTTRQAAQRRGPRGSCDGPRWSRTQR
jgi:signal transduction histidine kinase